MKIKLTMLLAMGTLAGDLMSAPLVTIDANQTYSGSDLTFSDQNITNEVNVFVKGASNSTLQLTDSTVSSNTLTNSANNGGAFISATNVTLDNVDMYGNTVSASSGSNYGFIGGTSISILNSEYSDNSMIDTNPSVNFAYGLVSHLNGSTKTLEVRGSTFNRNRIESSYSAGGVFSVMGGASANIYSSSFSENVAKGFDVDGRNAYSVTGSVIRVAGSATKLYVQDTAFLNNVTTADAPSGEYGVYGAICNYDGTMTFKDCSFIGNSAQNQTGIYGGGGAIYHSGGTLNIEITKDAAYTGNYVQDLSGAKLDNLGGFLYMDYPGAANFDIASGATLTIGNGAGGYDSIASQADVDGIVINKTGAGTLTVNGSMADYKGALNVTEGAMNVNNGLGGEANVSGAELNIANANYEGLSLVKPANGSPTAIVNATAGADLSLSDSSFKNNTVSTEGTANGTYGVAVGINSSNASIDNVVFENNTSKSTGSLMSQGVVYLTMSDSTSIANSKFIGNKSESESSYAMGGAVSSWGSNLDIENTIFSGNSVNGSTADGAAVYVAGNDWGGSNPSIVNISNSTFDGNVSEGSSISRGAGVFAGGDNVNTLIVNISDSVFTNNVAKGSDYVAGGAISVQDQQVNINVTKDMTYAGNQAIVNGVADDSRGGFLYINSKNVSSDTSFNISEGATLTIGDGRAGYDSIASRDEKAIINKNGAGALTVNGSMEYFTGSLAVNQGEMTVTNKLGASSVSIASDSVLKLSVGAEPVLTNESLAFSNAGTLALIAKGTDSGKIAAASGLDFGNVKAYGGTFDASSGMFTSGDNMEVSYGNLGGSSFDTAGTMKFSDDSSSLAIISQGEISFGNNVRDDALAADFFGVDLLAAWTVTYDSDDTVVLSFELDGDLSGATLYFQGDDGSWSKLDSWLDADTINTITGESGNFALAVPEPSAYAAIFGALALAFAAYRRRK